MQLKNVLRSVEEMHEKYTILINETIKIKQSKNIALENYIAECQEKERKITDKDLELLHQQMKIKLLHASLIKRSNEHNKL